MSVRVEESDVESFKKRLEAKGWHNGSNIVKVKERELVPLFFDTILREAIHRINKPVFDKLNSEEEEEILKEVFDKLQADEVKILQYIKYGIEVYLHKKQLKVTIKLLDYSKPENNILFYLVRPRFKGSPKESEPDIVLYVNGLPIIVIEVKRLIEPHSFLKALGQIRRYEMFSPELFRFVQFGIAIGDEERVTPTWPNWSRDERSAPSFTWIVKERSEDGEVRKENNITYILEPSRLFEYLRYFVFYRKEYGGGYGKIIARYNQYYAVKKVMDRIDQYMANGQLNHGLIWHWLGSGKTYIMFFIANYFLDKYRDRRPIIFFLVDRSDLEEQHEKVLTNIESPEFTQLFKKISGIDELHKLIIKIRESEYRFGIIENGVYLTTAQKFQRSSVTSESMNLNSEIEEFNADLLAILKKLGEEYLEWLHNEKPEEYETQAQILDSLKDKEKEEYLVKLGQVKGKNVLFLIDEVHRTQYGLLASMRKLVFPNALAFGFTGTPIFKHDRNTFQEFGYPDKNEYYLDVYFINDSIRDGFTLPLVYQAVKEGEISSEGVQIKLSEDDIKGFIEEYMKTRDVGFDILDYLDPTVYKKVGKYINKIRIFLMNKVRIDKLAKYIVNRLEEDTEGFKFKAMVVAVNRLACIRFKRSLDKYLVEKYGDDARDWAEIVMTYNYNDRDKEIVEYKEELQKRFKNGDFNDINKELQRKFLEEKNPRILIVTDMLITGFDAPMLKVMYLDKPLYEHRLLQAIARINRPYHDKKFGLIVDSIGILEHLSKTLALYNMLADEDIRKDFEENLMVNIDEKVEEFIRLYNKVKNNLLKLTLRDENVSIDLDILKKDLKANNFDRNEFEAKIGIIALVASSKGTSNDIVAAKKLLNDMYRTIKLFKALGSHPKKLFYAEDIEVLVFVYGSILKKMRRKTSGLGREFWDQLINFIQSKTIIDEFKEIATSEINDDTLNQLLETKVPSIELKRTVADYYFYIRSILANNLHDPIYREIMKRLQQLLKEWSMKKIDIKTFLAQLNDLEKERKNYEKRIKEMSTEEKIVEAINTYINSQVLNKTPVILKLSNVKKEIERILKNKISTIKTSDKQRISKELLKDLFIELKDKLDENKLAKLADRLSEEFIAEELEREIRNE